MADVRGCSDAVLQEACGVRALEAGRIYRRQGRVTELEISEDGRKVTSRVQGNERQPYRQTIAIEGRKPGVIGIDGECTCPVGYNCKHVAAALVAARESWRGAGPRPAPPASGRDAAVRPPQPALIVRQPSPAPGETLSHELSAWLNGLGAAQAAGSEDYPGDVRHRLVYLLGGYTERERHPQLAVWPTKARLLKDGRFGSDARSFDPYAMPALTPKFIRPADLAILGRLGRQKRHPGSPLAFSLADMAGADLLPAMLATGRARWMHLDGPLLTPGPGRAGAIAWRLGEDARQRVVVALDGVAPDAVDGPVVLAATPPVWVEPESGLIGPVDPGVNAMLAATMLAAPPIAPGDAAAVAKAIAAKGAAVAALAPPALRVDEVVAGPPTPMLRLEAADLPVDPPAQSWGYGWNVHGMTERVGIGRVAFGYDGLELAAEDGRAQPVLARRGRLVRVDRDLAAEQARLRELADCDLLPVAAARPSAARSHGAAVIAADGDPGWLDFLWHDRARLGRAGWRIVVAPDFPVRLAVPEDGLQARLSGGSGIDWLELDLGVTLDGAEVDLLPALVALILSPGFSATLAALGSDADDEPFFLPLPDGRVVGLPAARMQPILAVLAGLLLHRAQGKPRISPADAEALDALEQAGVGFRGGEALRALGRRLAQAGGIPDIAPPPWFAANLRPYQAKGLAWMQLLAGAGLGGVLADDMGLGKTVQTLAHLAVEKAAGRLDAPALIVAPTSLVGNWTREAARFAPELALLVLHGLDRKKDFERIAGADLVLTTYPLVARDHAMLAARDWHVLVLDEAQAIKNPDATTTKIVAKLKARQRLCLTGTPLENHLGELWSLFNVVNPGFLGDRKGFTSVYRNPIEKKGDGERARALARRVRPFMLRRTKAEVAPELPPKTEITETIELGAAQRDVYETIRLTMHEKVRSAIAARGFGQSRIVILDALLKLRQAVCDPRLLKLGRGDKAGSAKLERLMEMLDELLSESRRILLFSQFTSMLALIEERLTARGVAYALLTGESRNRPAIIARFQDGEVPVFLVSLKAGGTGLNLTAADTVILYDPWWNPAVEDQAIDRAHRIGQDKPVFVHRLVAQDTIEQKMDLLKDRKRALSAGLFDADGAPTLAMTEADIELLLG